MNEKTAKNPKGAGRKKQFENPAILNFKVELSTKIEVKKLYGLKLNGMFNEWLNSLITPNRKKS